MASDIDHLAGVAVCGCGDCQKAVKDALAEFQRLSREQCLHWYFTQVTIHAVIVNLIVEDPRVDPRYRQAIVGKQQALQEHLITEDVLQYLTDQIEAIDAANALVGGGGKVN